MPSDWTFGFVSGQATRSAICGRCWGWRHRRAVVPDDNFWRGRGRRDPSWAAGPGFQRGGAPTLPRFWGNVLIDKVLKEGGKGFVVLDSGPNTVGDVLHVDGGQGSHQDVPSCCADRADHIRGLLPPSEISQLSPQLSFRLLVFADQVFR